VATEEVESTENQMSGKPTNRDLAFEAL
jgi:hypothetical protein